MEQERTRGGRRLNRRNAVAYIAVVCLLLTTACSDPNDPGDGAPAGPVTVVVQNTAVAGLKPLQWRVVDPHGTVIHTDSVNAGARDSVSLDLLAGRHTVEWTDSILWSASVRYRTTPASTPFTVSSSTKRAVSVNAAVITSGTLVFQPELQIPGQVFAHYPFTITPPGGTLRSYSTPATHVADLLAPGSYRVSWRPTLTFFSGAGYTLVAADSVRMFDVTASTQPIRIDPGYVMTSAGLYLQVLDSPPLTFPPATLRWTNADGTAGAVECAPGTSSSGNPCRGLPVGVPITISVPAPAMSYQGVTYVPTPASRTITLPATFDPAPLVQFRFTPATAP